MERVENSLLAFGLRAAPHTLQDVTLIGDRPGLRRFDRATVLVLNDREDQRVFAPDDSGHEAVPIGSGTGRLLPIRGVTLHGVFLRVAGSKDCRFHAEFGVVMDDSQRYLSRTCREAMSIILLPDTRKIRLRLREERRRAGGQEKEEERSDVVESPEKEHAMTIPDRRSRMAKGESNSKR